MSEIIVLENARILDGTSDEGERDRFVTIEGGVICEVADVRPSGDARRVDLRGRTLMPGLIDAHCHVVAGLADLGANARLPDATVALRAARLMHEMLMRGFTTVRDLGGASQALVDAVETGLIEGPRLVICGKALSQTGGHNDWRGRHDDRNVDDQANFLGAMGRICDGLDAVRHAARDEIRRGANFLKVMANGGVSSPTDPIAFLGFSNDELKAVVEEATNAKTYVAAHLYTDEAIRRALDHGITSIEHGNLIEPDTARRVRDEGAIVCPTLITFEALKREGFELGLGADSVAKIDDVRLRGMQSLEIMHEAGVTMAYGSDLLGPMHRHQSEEFVLRRQVLPAIEVIRAATINAARLLRMEGKIGVVAARASADLIVVDGDPLEDISLLTGQGAHLMMIIKGGKTVKSEIN